jgi:hypothetical protein
VGENCPIAALCNIKPTETGLDLNQGLGSERPATDRLSLDLRLCISVCAASMFHVFIILLVLLHSPIKITKSRHVCLSVCLSVRKNKNFVLVFMKSVLALWQMIRHTVAKG